MTNQQPSFIDKASNWIKTSIMLKMLTIGFLILLLLIPENMVETLIKERSQARNGVIKEVSSKWGSSQNISGPILTIPYITKHSDGKKHYTKKHFAHFLPSKVTTNGKVNPQEKHRGIYNVILYDAELNVEGRFDKIDLEALHLKDTDMVWDEAEIAMGITDMRGITDIITINWSGQKIPMNPGIENAQMILSGVHAKVNLSASTETDTLKVMNSERPTSLIFTYTLHVNGSGNLSFTPIAKQTAVNLSSTWHSPKFDGAFLPQNQEVSDKGFTSQWKVINLNRNYPQQWKEKAYEINNSAFGVDFILPVDEYQKTLRSAKYASLIVLLTFIAFFFVEIANDIRIHPLQYVLVGSALVLFYTLLLSFSEHFGFNYAYIISTLMIASLIGMYARFMFNNKAKAALMTLGLGSIYSFMFFVLNSEDYALLMGSIGLFVILSIVMYGTRNIKFYTSN
jgi:inner membrane protein